MASIPLPSTTDKLQLVTAQAVTVDVAVFFAQYNPSDSARPTFDRQLTAITTAFTTDILAAPGASLTRGVKNIIIRNKHAADSVTVTVLYNANGTLFELHKVTLAAGEALEWIEGTGFFVLGAASPSFVKSLAADQSNSTTTATEVTGLTLATAVGNFVFQYFLLYQSSATTTGIKLSANYSGTVTFFVATARFAGVTTTASAADAGQAVVAAAAGIHNSLSQRAKSTAGVLITASVDVANGDMLMALEGVMVVTVAGSLALWHGSETAAATTIKAGSSLVLNKTG